MIKRKIYIDMDGVVADFNKFVSEILGREIGWEGRDLSDEEWQTLCNVDKLYFKLPLIQDSTKLVALAKSFSTRFDIEFLTAVPRTTSIPSAGQDKIDWINKYYPGMKVNFGPYSRDKKNWAKPGYILIDDKRSNVVDWAMKGGLSIFHTGDYEQTINNLLSAIDTVDKEGIIFGNKQEQVVKLL